MPVVVVALFVVRLLLVVTAALAVVVMALIQVLTLLTARQIQGAVVAAEVVKIPTRTAQMAGLAS